MFIKRILYILLALVVVALIFQLTRTFVFTRYIQNTNELDVLEEKVSADIPEDAVFDRYLVISNSEVPNSLTTSSQVEQVLQYLKIGYDQFDVLDQQDISLSDYHCTILCFERLDLIEDITAYTDYVRSGGCLIFALRPVVDATFMDISRQLAISSYDGMNDRTDGITVIDPLMIGTERGEYGAEFIQNSCINAELDNSKAHLYISAGEDIPLLWSAAYGTGQFVVFNGTMLNEKNNRGLTTSIISLSRDDFIYPVANIKMVHIDDFPAPIPIGTDESIMEEFNRTIPQFYRDIWWSDMLRYATIYDLTYSAFVIENYNNDTVPPFERSGMMDEDTLLRFGKELLNIGGEIGIHGYNHQSLAPEGYIKQDLGYNSWASQEDMEASIEELVDFINGVFRTYTVRAYVPPSNILSDTGRSAVIAAAPDLKILAGVYLNNYEGDVYMQEFEVAADGIIEFPRISSGYFKSPDVMWSIYSAVNTHGVFSHFIHPDDILDPDRNHGLSWSEMSKQYKSLLEEVYDKYPWLRSMTVSEGGEELIKYLEIKPYIEYGQDTINIYCEDFRPDSYFIMRTDREIKDSENIEYEKIADDAYLLIMDKASGTLSLEEK